MQLWGVPGLQWSVVASVFLYLDNILIASTPRVEHMSHLWTFFERLSQHFASLECPASTSLDTMSLMTGLSPYCWRFTPSWPLHKVPLPVYCRGHPLRDWLHSHGSRPSRRIGRVGLQDVQAWQSPSCNWRTWPRLSQHHTAVWCFHRSAMACCPCQKFSKLCMASLTQASNLLKNWLVCLARPQERHKGFGLPLHGLPMRWIEPPYQGPPWHSSPCLRGGSTTLT